MRVILIALLAGVFLMGDVSIKESIAAFKERRRAAEQTQEGRALKAVAPRGPSPEQAAIKDAIAAFKFRRRGASTGRSDSADVNAKSMGVYPDSGSAYSGVLRSASTSKPQREVARPVFADDEAFSAVEAEAAEGFRPFKSSSRARRLNVHHWTPPKKAAPYLNKIREVEELYGFPDNLMASLIHQESKWNPRAKSKAGAKGLTQLMPIHKEIDPYDPDASIEYSARYLSKLKERFGSWDQALAAYNWGPSNLKRHIRKHGGMRIDKLPKETRNYIKKVLGNVHVED